MAETEQFTAAQAAFVLCEPVRAVKRAFDTGPVRPALIRRSGIQVRAIAWRDLVYLYAARTLRDELTPKARADFYEALQRTTIEREREVRFGRFSVVVSDLIQDVERRTAELAKLADRVEFRADGEPVLRGTDIEVYRIAALLAGGMSVEDIETDYPSLSRDAIEAAKAYADAHPKPGRPYPKTTAKRALREAGLEALDEVLGNANAPE